MQQFDTVMHMRNITIMQAARLLKKNYLQVYNLVAKGMIAAQQDKNGHWLLSVESVVDYGERLGTIPGGIAALTAVNIRDDQCSHD